MGAQAGAYRAAYEASFTDPAGFWLEAAQDIDWVTPPTAALDDSGKPVYRWFPGAEINTCYNAIDRHVEAGNGHRTALIYDSAMTNVKDIYTYSRGPILMGIISAVAFATILAVVAGLTITAATSFAHDIYASVIRRGEVSPNGEVKIARITVVVIGIAAIAGGIGVQGQNIAFLVALAFAVAASANLPTIIYSLYWRKFRTRGALWSIYGGLISSIVLIAVSPVVSNATPAATSTAMIKGVDFHLWDLSNPGIISIPLAFLLGWLGSVIPGGKKENSWLAAEMEVRSLTGHGAEKEVHH